LQHLDQNASGVVCNATDEGWRWWWVACARPSSLGCRWSGGGSDPWPNNFSPSITTRLLFDSIFPKAPVAIWPRLTLSSPLLLLLLCLHESYSRVLQSSVVIRITFATVVAQPCIIVPSSIALASNPPPWRTCESRPSQGSELSKCDNGSSRDNC
jgi:hypothetical protein